VLTRMLALLAKMSPPIIEINNYSAPEYRGSLPVAGRINTPVDCTLVMRAWAAVISAVR